MLGLLFLHFIQSFGALAASELEWFIRPSYIHLYHVGQLREERVEEDEEEDAKMEEVRRRKEGEREERKRKRRKKRL